MTHLLERTLKKWRQTQFGYDNQNDCLLSLADYLIECGYPDFGKKFRGTFDSETSALEHVSLYGSVENIINETGLRVFESAEDGDLILVQFGKIEVAGIYSQGSVHFRSSRGVVSLLLKVCKMKRIWRVEIA